MLWHVKLATMIAEFLPANTSNPSAEVEAVNLALLELGITACLETMGESDAYTFVKNTFDDIAESRKNKDHWRNCEDREMIELSEKIKRHRQAIP